MYCMTTAPAVKISEEGVYQMKRMDQAMTQYMTSGPRVMGRSPRVIMTRGRSCVVRTVVPEGTLLPS